MPGEFSNHSRLSIGAAQEQAVARKDNAIGTEHLLLGVISGGDSLAAKILDDLGISLLAVFKEVDAVTKDGSLDGPEENHRSPLQQVVTRAFEESREMNYNYVGTEHLLLGLAQVQAGGASKVLASLGAVAQQIRSQAILLRSQ